MWPQFIVSRENNIWELIVTEVFKVSGRHSSLCRQATTFDESQGYGIWALMLTVGGAYRIRAAYTHTGSCATSSLPCVYTSLRALTQMHLYTHAAVWVSQGINLKCCHTLTLCKCRLCLKELVTKISIWIRGTGAVTSGCHIWRFLVNAFLFPQ